MDHQGLDVFEVTEEPEELLGLDTPPRPYSAGASEPVNLRDHDDVVQKLEMLRAEMLKLGKAQINTRTSADSRYRVLRETIEAFLSNNDHMAETVIRHLFSIADGLEAGVRAGETISSPEMGSWLDGIKIVQQSVMELLEKFDVHPLYSVGKPFDPSLHTAVAVEHKQEINDNIILEEQRRGYMRGGEVIRYAEVVVNKRPPEPAMQVEENDLRSPSARRENDD